MNMIRFIRKHIFRTTQQDFAKIAGVTQAAISNWEKESAPMPSLKEIRAIRSAALSRGLDWNDSFLFQPDIPDEPYEDHSA